MEAERRYAIAWSPSELAARSLAIVLRMTPNCFMQVVCLRYVVFVTEPPPHLSQLFRPRSWRMLEALRDFNKLPNQRAVRLLRQNLSLDQRRQYDNHRFFDITGGATGDRYRIHVGYQLNVERYGVHGALVQVLCFSPNGTLPVPDIMLAQKIALELFEDNVLAVASMVLVDPRLGLPARGFPIWR